MIKIFIIMLNFCFSVIPKFDLTVITQRETPLTAKLIRNTTIRQAFIRRYCEVFEQYVSWKIALQKRTWILFPRMDNQYILIISIFWCELEIYLPKYIMCILFVCYVFLSTDVMLYNKVLKTPFILFSVHFSYWRWYLTSFTNHT